MRLVRCVSAQLSEQWQSKLEAIQPSAMVNVGMFAGQKGDQVTIST